MLDKKITIAEAMNQSDLNSIELIEHTLYMNSEYYDFKLTQEDTLRFNSALELINSFKELIGLVIETSSNFSCPSYLDEKIEMVYNYLNEEKDYEKILSAPRETIIEVIDSTVYWGEWEVKGSENGILVGDMITAFSNIMFSYLQEHKEYSKHLKCLYLGV